MATPVQVQCINKTPRYDPHDRIQAIGGVHSGSRWKRSQPQAIIDIESGTYSYYVHVPGTGSVWVIVAKHNGNKYLKTENDGDQPNNLLSLPECP